MAIVSIAALAKAKRLHGRRRFQGLEISVENRRGSVRRWHNPDDGTSGEQRMAHPYGYIRGTVGMDGDHVDCYVGPHEDAANAYVVTQTKAPDFRQLDEQKVMLGFESEAEAKRAYLDHMNDPRFFAGIQTIPMVEFKARVLATHPEFPVVKAEPEHAGEQHSDERGERGGPVDTHRPKLVIRNALVKAHDPSHEPRHPDDTTLAATPAMRELARGHGELSEEVDFHMLDAGAMLYALIFEREEFPDEQSVRQWITDRETEHDLLRTGKAEVESAGAEWAVRFGGPGHAFEPPNPKGLEQARVRVSGAHAVWAIIGMPASPLTKGGPYIGPKGGKWADPKHTIPWAGADDRAKLLGRHRVKSKWAAGDELGSGGFATVFHAGPNHVVKVTQSKADGAALLALAHAGSDAPEGLPRVHDAKLLTSGEHATHTGARVERLDTKLSPAERTYAEIALDLDEAKSVEAVTRYLEKYENHRVPAAERAEAAKTISAWSKHLSEGKAWLHKHVSPHAATDPAVDNIALRRKGDKTTAVWIDMGRGGGQAEQLSDFQTYVRKAERFPRLYALLKSAQHPPPGFMPIPKGTKGGYRKRVADGWVYWYPTAGGGHEKPEPVEWGEAEFRAGTFDKSPGHWHYIRAGEGRTDIHSWTGGGVDPESKHPVKIAGRETRLYQIVEPEVEKGWARLRDVNTGDEVLIQHDRVYPVEHERRVAQPKPKARPVAPKPGQKPQRPPTEGKPTGWLPGSAERIPAYADSTAKEGTALHRVESGYYPRKLRRLWHTDADGAPHKVEDQVLAIPDSDKVQLLAELQPLVRKAAERARKRMGVKRTPEAVEDLRAAAMEGMLHAVDNYRGGYSFTKSAASYAEQYARLHAAREFAGGFGMSAREARLMPGFLAARAEANAGQAGDADAGTIARYWRLFKRDRHPGLTTGKNSPIPLGRYSLKAGEIVSGVDKPGKVELAQAYLEFVDGQSRGGLEIQDSGPLLPGAGVGYGQGAAEQLEHEHDLARALEGLAKFDLVVGRNIYRLDAAELVRRRLGLGREPQSPRAIAAQLPIYRIARGGALKQVSPRLAADLIEPALNQALDHVRDRLDDKVAGLVERAKQRLATPTELTRGITAKQRIEADSRKVSVEDVRAWRAAERARLRKLEARYQADGDTDRVERARTAHARIATISTKQAKRIIAERRILLAPRSREWFQTAIAKPIDFRDPRNEYGHGTITMTDPTTGAQRQVKVRTMRDLSSGDEAYKADSALTADTGIVRLAMLYPRLAHTLWGSDDPMAHAATVDRAVVLEAMGF